MSNVFFIGDLHFGHKNVTRFRTEFASVEEHDGYLIGQWCSRVTKNDLVFVLGDAAFTIEGLEEFKALPGRKFLVRGNHDVFAAQRYLVFFEDIQGIQPYKGSGLRAWLTHAPIHPDELRGRVNIHGHVHTNTIRTEDGEIDKRYFNASAENIGYEPIPASRIAELLNES